MGFTYKESSAVKKAREEAERRQKAQPAQWTGGTYGKELNNILNRINNREKFTYDLNGDALYQQYKQNYMNQGKLAMMDTMGQASALTGGYGSSYAETVGNQAYQGYLQKLNDVVPQLYQMAYDKYNNETQDLYNQFGVNQSMYDSEYGRYRDTVSDYYTDRDFYTNLFNNERNFDLGVQQLKNSGGGGVRKKKTKTEKTLTTEEIEAMSNDYVAQINQSWNAMIGAHGLGNNGTSEEQKRKLMNTITKGADPLVVQAVEKKLFAGKDKIWDYRGQ